MATATADIEKKYGALRQYKYACTDKSLMSRVLRPYWNWSMCLVPLWIAPNLLTLIGFAFMLVNMALVVFFVPSLAHPVPWWLGYVSAACLWLYSTLDNLDGKQARRTNSSSPLGELFDHGCDALNCFMASLIQCAIVANGHSMHSFVYFVCTSCGFFCSTWEHFHTGALFLNYISAPSEGVVMSCVLMAISSAVGSRMWDCSVAEALPAAFVAVLPASLRSFFMRRASDFLMRFTVVLLFATLIPFSLYNVYVSGRRRMQTPFGAAVAQLMPLCLFYYALWTWIGHPDSSLLRRTSNVFLWFIGGAGLAFGRLVSEIVLRHLIHAPFPLLVRSQLPFIAVGFLLHIPTFQQMFFRNAAYEAIVVAAICLLALADYALWARRTVREMCLFLGIRCFSLANRVKTE